MRRSLEINKLMNLEQIHALGSQNFLGFIISPLPIVSGRLEGHLTLQRRNDRKYL
jgi:hypothetical protein